MSSTTLHVIVIGGGIGGLCLAQGLKAAGVSVAVYERNAPTTWLEGYRIHINPIGSRALHACLPPTLWEVFTAIAGRPPTGLGFLTKQLEELLVIADDFMSNATGNVIDAHYPVSRLALRHLLLTGLDDVILFNKTFERYEQTAEGKVVAYFADGTSVTGDLLIAADGANSKVRQQYLPHAPRMEIGAAAVGGKFLLTEQTRTWLPHQLRMRLNLIMPTDRYCLFTAPFEHANISDDAPNNICERAQLAGLNSDLLLDTAQDYLLWALIAQSSEYPGNMQQFDEKSLLHVVDKMMAEWHPKLRQISAASALNSVSFNTFKASTLLESWESTNVTLLGDAIHNMPPVGGLGGNMALRDAAALVYALTDVQCGSSALLPAIQTYEAEMRKYGFAAVRASLVYTRQATTNNRIERLGSNAWFQICRVVPPLKRAFEEQWTRSMRNSLQSANVQQM